MDGKVHARSDLETQAIKRASLSTRCSQLCPSLIPSRQLNFQDSSFNPEAMQNDGFRRVTAFLLQETSFWDTVSA